jgi:hypothetical protein
VPEPRQRDVVAEAKAELDAKLAEMGTPVEDVDTTDPLARIMDKFGPDTEVVEP